MSNFPQGNFLRLLRRRFFLLVRLRLVRFLTAIQHSYPGQLADPQSAKDLVYLRRDFRVGMMTVCGRQQSESVDCFLAADGHVFGFKATVLFLQLFYSGILEFNQCLELFHLDFKLVFFIVR